MNKPTKKETHHLLTTRADRYTYDDYVGYCIEMDIEYGSEGSMEYYEWCEDEARDMYEYYRENLQHSELKDRMFVIEGTLELWHGKSTIEPVVIHGIIPAIERCFGTDIDNIDVALNTKDGVIYVNSYHHDGTNRFTLKMLNKNGEKWIKNALNKWLETKKDGEEFDLNKHYWSKITDIKQIWK